MDIAFVFVLLSLLVLLGTADETRLSTRQSGSTTTTASTNLNTERRALTPEKVQSHCNVTKVYYPTTEESWWRQNVGALASNGSNWTKPCITFREKAGKTVEEWMHLWQKREKFPMTQKAMVNWSNKVGLRHPTIPYFLVHDDCSPKGTMPVKIPIEPLVGFLRHPKYLCYPLNVNKRVSKDYMFPTHEVEIFPKLIDRATNTRRGRAFLFDLGCSSYSKGWGGASESWFIDTYRARNIEFDRILAWEKTQIDPKQMFSGYPSEVLNSLSFFNVPADPNPAGKHNPLRMMRDLCMQADFVVLKIDIDHATTEAALIAQLISDPTLYSLVDELYFEHHVYRSGISPSWKNSMKFDDPERKETFTHLIDPPSPPGVTYAPGKVVADNDITASYAIFHVMRELGIRAHAWV